MIIHVNNRLMILLRAVTMPIWQRVSTSKKKPTPPNNASPATAKNNLKPRKKLNVTVSSALKCRVRDTHSSLRY